MERSFARLKGRMEELKDLSGVIGLCSWDQETLLPPKAAGARGQQLATLQGIYHERLVDPAVGDWLGEAEAEVSAEDDRAMLRVFRHERDRAVKVPPSLVRALATAQSDGITAWRAAREAKDFSLFRDALRRLLVLRRQQADALGHDGERYDALLEAYEPGMRVSRLRPVIESLREKLVPIVGKLTSGEAKWPDCFAGKQFDPEKQWPFTVRLLGDLGFDLEAGRQDKSIHPFCGGTHPNDVRLTTRLFADNVCSGIFSTIHEGGHGLYEQGFDERHHRTPLAAAPSMGLHESQSRMWENIIGRSRAFWSHYLPVLQSHFPEQLGDVTLDALHKTINTVSRSLVRVEADEVTYNLHVALRFELELLLIDDALPLDDLPAAWNDRMEKYLGVRPPHDTLGVLQDIHWAWGELGYFPTYTLGNLYAAQLFEAMRAELPDVEEAISQGRLRVVREWLREKIHRHGYRYPAETLVEKISGRGISDEAFVRYLKTKYGQISGVAL